MAVRPSERKNDGVGVLLSSVLLSELVFHEFPPELPHLHRCLIQILMVCIVRSLAEEWVGGLPSYHA